MVDDLVLEQLRHIRGVVDRTGEDVADLKLRVTALEIGQANFAAQEATHYAGLAVRLDRTDKRLERIEARLELTDA